jgi:hypothetical protein
MTFSVTQQPLVSQGFLFIEASRSHSDTPHSLGLLRTSDQADAETPTSQHTVLAKKTDIHAPDGIRIGNPSKQAAEDPRLRRRDHWNRQFVFCGMSNSVHTTLMRNTATLIPKQGVLPRAQFVRLLFHLETKCEYTDTQTSSRSRNVSNLANIYHCSH